MCKRDRYSADQMAQHGKALAASHRLAAGSEPDRLLGRLAANETTLVGVCKLLTSASAEKRRITPVSYTHLRAHETVLDLVCRLLLEKKTQTKLPNDCRHQRSTSSTHTHRHVTDETLNINTVNNRTTTQ